METLQIYLKQLKDYGNITKTQRIQTEMPLRDLETLIDTRMDNNVISHVHSILYLLMSLYFSSCSLT